MKDKRAFDNFDQFAESYREIHDVSIKYTGTNSEYFSEYKILELLKFEKSDTPLKVLENSSLDLESLYSTCQDPSSLRVTLVIIELNLILLLFHPLEMVLTPTEFGKLYMLVHIQLLKKIYP